MLLMLLLQLPRLLLRLLLQLRPLIKK